MRSIAAASTLRTWVWLRPSNMAIRRHEKPLARAHKIWRSAGSHRRSHSKTLSKRSMAAGSGGCGRQPSTAAGLTNGHYDRRGRAKPAGKRRKVSAPSLSHARTVVSAH